MEHTYLALDLGRHTGWVSGRVVNKALVTTSGTKVMRVGHEPYDFYVFIKELLCCQEAPKTVFYEQVRRHMSTDAAHAYGGYQGILKSQSEVYGAKVIPLAVGSIKKFWTGDGSAKKDAMIKEAVRRGYSPSDDNEADALAILYYGLSGLLGGNPLELKES